MSAFLHDGDFSHDFFLGVLELIDETGAVGDRIYVGAGARKVGRDERSVG